MATSTGFVEHLLREHEGIATELSAERVAPARRRTAVQRMAELGLPHVRDDYWRYASLRALEKARLAPARRWHGDYDAAVLGLPAPLPGIPRRVFVDGHHVPSLAQGELDPHALQLSAPTLRDTIPAPPADAPSQRFAWLNEAFLEDGASLTVGAGREAAVEIVFVATPTDAGAASYPRLEVTLAPQAKLTLIERHLGSSGAGSLINAAVHCELGAHAGLQHYRVQSCARDALFLDSLLARVGDDADYCLTMLGLGAQSARSSLRIDLAGRAATTRLRAMALADEARVLDLAVLVAHIAPATQSRQLFRTVASHRSRVGCNSEVRIDETAAGAGSQQSLKGLIGANAEVNLRPQLEILTDDVTASHGATTGALDENTLFYLLSRGIDPGTARVLLEWAFLEDVLAQIELPELRREVEANSIALLGNVPTLKELL